MLASKFTLRRILNNCWILVALLCLDTSQVLGLGNGSLLVPWQLPLSCLGTYSTRMRRDGALVVFEASGNASSRNSSGLELQDAVDRAAREGMDELVLETEELVLKRSLLIRRSLVISSGQPNSSKTELRCGGVNQIFDIQRTSSENVIVELRSVRITNCTTRDSDGIVHVGSGAGVVFEDVELVNNKAEGINHSLIVVDSDATLEVRGNSLFTNNRGRVMLVGKGSEVIIENSSFTNNTARANGSVLATRPGGEIQLHVSGSHFEGNAAEEGSGGVMWLESSNVTFEGNVSFISNVADHDGGALFLSDSLGLQITDTVFESNACRFGKGGAIVLLSSVNSTTQIRRSIFSKNSANGFEGLGGAIAFKNVDANSTQELKLGSDVLFLKNTARVSGGAVFVNGTNAIIDSSSAFINNTAQGEGGGAYISSSAYHESAEEYDVGSVLEASFINNSAPFRGGGALVVHGGAKFSIVNSNFTNNMACKGGAVFGYDDVRISITNYTLFRGNVATENGGSITMFNGRRMTLRLCRFENNSAGVLGGGINVMTTARFDVTDSSFLRNRAGQGGAINVENAEILRGRETKTTLENVTFSNNWSLKARSNEGYGGAMRLSGGGLDTNLSSCKFENNEARWGGGIYMDKAFETNVRDTKFSSNVADLGGALYVAPLERELRGKDDSTTFDSCTFEENKAIRGGAIFGRPDRPFSGGSFQLSNSSFEIKTSQFHRNRASDAGGGLFLALMSASFDECSFESNTANRSDSESTGNSQLASRLPAGGAIYASDGSSLTLSDTHFIANNASGRGGAVCIDDALFICTRACTFQANYGRDGGGMFYSLSSQKNESNQPAIVHCNDCMFVRNEARKGGGVYTSIPRSRPSAQHQPTTCQESNASDKKSTGAASVGEVCEDLVFLNLTQMKDNNASVNGRAVFSTQPCAIVVSTDNGNMNLVQHVDTMMNKENSAYMFGSPAYTVRRNISGSSLDSLNRGDTGEEMSQLGFEILDHFCQRVDYSRIVVELKACQDSRNCCGDSGETVQSFIFAGEEKRVVNHGMVNFANLNISNGPNGNSRQRLWICFEDEGEERAQLDPVSIDVSFRECYTMEVNDSNSGGCKECPQGKYYESKTNSCKTCPPHATCRGLTVVPDGEHWHATSVSHRIYKCHPRKACVDDTSHLRSAATSAHKERRIRNWTDSEYDQCNKGYEGIVCGSCQQTHGRWNDICTDCLAIPLMWISFLASVCWNLIVLLVFIYSARCLVDRARYNQLATSQHQETNGLSPSLVRQIELFRRTPRITDGFLHMGPLDESSAPGSFELETTNIEARRWTPSAMSSLRRRRFQEIMPIERLPLANPLSEALKITINFLQVVYLAALLSEDLPSVFRWAIIPFDAMNLTEPVFLIVDCLLKGNEDRAIIRMTLQALFPVLLVFFICLIPALLLLFGKCINFGLQKVKLVALCTVYLYFVPEIRTLMKFLDKVKVEDEYADLGASHFWSVDTSVKFLQGSHAIVVGVIVFPLLIAFTICFPLSLFVSLRKNKERMQEEDVVSSYGFLYKGYESKYYYWEIVIVVRKTVIAIVSVFVQNAELQCVFISLTLVLFLSLQLRVSPFSSDFPGLNLLESLSLGVSTSMFMGVSLMLRAHVLGKNQLLYAIAWCTLFVLVATVLGMGVGLFAATQDFLNDKLIEKQLYPDKKSVECLSFTTKIHTLVLYYIQSLLSHLPIRENQQAPAIEVGLERL